MVLVFFFNRHTPLSLNSGRIPSFTRTTPRHSVCSIYYSSSLVVHRGRSGVRGCTPRDAHHVSAECTPSGVSHRQQPILGRVAAVRRSPSHIPDGLYHGHSRPPTHGHFHLYSSRTFDIPPEQLSPTGSIIIVSGDGPAPEMEQFTNGIGEDARHR